MAVYTTDVEVSKRISAIGVTLRTDHDFTSLLQSMEWASREIDFWIQSRYPSIDLAANGWVQYVACVLAVWHLCWTRLNSIPTVVDKQKQDILEKLKLIQQGEVPLPGAPSPGSAPALINSRVALGSYPPILVESAECVGPGIPPPRRNDPFQPPIGPRP